MNIFGSVQHNGYFEGGAVYAMDYRRNFNSALAFGNCEQSHHGRVYLHPAGGGGDHDLGAANPGTPIHLARIIHVELDLITVRSIGQL
jgi:hypothetical protein